jgi:site-specific recombinase XerD
MPQPSDTRRVKALAVHQSISTTQRYSHPGDDALQDAVEGVFAEDHV